MIAEKRKEVERAKNANHSIVHIQVLEDKLAGFECLLLL